MFDERNKSNKNPDRGTCVVNPSENRYRTIARV